jgi:hypothetical protein
MRSHLVELSPFPAYDSNLFLGCIFSFPVAGLVFGWGNTNGWGSLDTGGKVEEEKKDHKEVKQVKNEKKVFGWGNTNGWGGLDPDGKVEEEKKDHKEVVVKRVKHFWERNKETTNAKNGEKMKGRYNRFFLFGDNEED